MKDTRLKTRGQYRDVMAREGRTKNSRGKRVKTVYVCFLMIHHCKFTFTNSLYFLKSQLLIGLNNLLSLLNAMITTPQIEQGPINATLITLVEPLCCHDTYIIFT